MEDCQSGLSYLFAKEMVAKAAQRFESSIFRQKIDKYLTMR